MSSTENKIAAVLPKNACDICGVGTLHVRRTSQDIEYRGVLGRVRTLFSECDTCGSETADAKQVLENRRELIRLKKSIDRIPLGSEIAAMRKRHSLTQQDAAKMFGGGPVAFSKYENDDLIPDAAMCNLLYLALNVPGVVSSLAAKSGIELAQSYGAPTELGCFEQSSDALEAKIVIVDEDGYKGPERRKRASVGVESAANFESPGQYGGGELWKH